MHLYLHNALEARLYRAVLIPARHEKRKRLRGSVVVPPLPARGNDVSFFSLNAGMLVRAAGGEHSGDGSILLLRKVF